MKRIALLLFLIVACSKQDEVPCQCETLRFVGAIFIEPNKAMDYYTADCLSYWEAENINVKIDYTSTPVSITGPTKEQVDISKQKAGNCD